MEEGYAVCNTPRGDTADAITQRGPVSKIIEHFSHARANLLTNVKKATGHLPVSQSTAPHMHFDRAVSSASESELLTRRPPCGEHEAARYTAVC